jgi:mRNA-degrading endonuclease HigB of HigAB toxin-antitoxin module
MTTNFEEEAEAYYAAKENYTDLLHKAASEDRFEAGSANSQAPAEEEKGPDNWLVQEVDGHEALARLVEDLAVIMKKVKIETSVAQPQEAKPDPKSKGKKK